MPARLEQLFTVLNVYLDCGQSYYWSALEPGRLLRLLAKTVLLAPGQVRRLSPNGHLFYALTRQACKPDVPQIHLAGTQIES